MTTVGEAWEDEGCAWLVPTAPGWRSVRPCGKPTSATVTDGRLEARVCARHHARLITRGWLEVRR